MKNVKREPKFVRRCKRSTRAIAVAVLAGSMFLGTGVTAEAAKLADVFDTQAYANKYPDLFAAFGNNTTALLKHYKEHGIVERREVEGILDVVRYREAYPDLEAAFGDNWDSYVNHYLIFGAKEGRENFTSFDGLAYAERYPDLKEAYGNDILALYKHYQAFGKTEGRDAGEEVYEEPEEESSEARTETVYSHDGIGLAFLDDYGRVVEEYYYNDDGSVNHWYEYTYNDDGSYVSTCYYADGSHGFITVFYSDRSWTRTYYDAAGRPTHKDERGPGGKFFRDTTYYANGNINSISEYDSNGDRIVTFYNEDGSIKNGSILSSGSWGTEKIIQSTGYNADGALSHKFEYEYDSAANLTKRTEYFYHYQDGKLDYYRKTVYDGNNNQISSEIIYP